MNSITRPFNNIFNGSFWLLKKPNRAWNSMWLFCVVRVWSSLGEPGERTSFVVFVNSNSLQIIFQANGTVRAYVVFLWRNRNHTKLYGQYWIIFRKKLWKVNEIKSYSNIQWLTKKTTQLFVNRIDLHIKECYIFFLNERKK